MFFKRNYLYDCFIAHLLMRIVLIRSDISKKNSMMHVHAKFLMWMRSWQP